jgi:DNA-binding protein HU-beta
MTRKELIEMISVAPALTGKNISKAGIEAVLDALADVAAAELLVGVGGEVPLPGLGKLKAKQRKACTRRNPKTGEKLEVPARLAVTFTPGKELKEALR